MVALVVVEVLRMTKVLAVVDTLEELVMWKMATEELVDHSMLVPTKPIPLRFKLVWDKLLLLLSQLHVSQRRLL